MKPNPADHPSTHWIRTAVITIVVAAVTTVFLSTCVRPWLERETAPVPATPSSLEAASAWCLANGPDDIGGCLAGFEEYRQWYGACVLHEDVSSLTVAPTQTARIVVQIVTATPGPSSLLVDQNLAYCLQVSPMAVSDCMAGFVITTATAAPVDTPVVCPMICPSSQHLAWCLGLNLDGADDVAACLYQLSDLDRLATDTVNMNATEAWAGVLPIMEVPCADPPARHTPIHLISRTTVRGYPASFGPNLGQAEGGLVRPLVEARVSREDGNLWYHLLEIPTNDNPFGVSGWIRAAYADCLVPTATPEAP